MEFVDSPADRHIPSPKEFVDGTIHQIGETGRLKLLTACELAYGKDQVEKL